jgi:cyclopropane-fatty-acyl-phospholipid synthase
LSIVNFLAVLRHWNPRKKSRRNVAHHYDLSDALFDTFLDPWRQYSCAYFHDPDESLDTAQVNKLARLAAKLDLQAGDNILDIGCGWGGLGMAMAACGRNTRVTGITLSRHQLEYARTRAAASEFEDRVSYHLRDYRDQSGMFQKIVSVGMLEHVGLANFSSYFNKIKSLLADDPQY